MARIAEAEIERLKKDISLERLVEARGVELRRHGKDLLGLCPFHEDREPSLVVSPEKNLWHCLGACQTGGSVIDWVMKGEGVSFRHAVERLRGDAVLNESVRRGVGRPPKDGRAVPKQSSVRTLPCPVDRDADDDGLLLQVVDFYQRTLKESPEALAYLQGRGLMHPEMIDTFRLGFANRTLGYRLPILGCKEGAELRGRLQRLGIMRESGHEHMNGSLVIPIFDESGRVTEMYGRKITPKLRPGTPLHLYLPGPHRGVWNLEAFARSEEIVVCESLIDALTFWCAGFRNVTAAYGVEGFTEDHWAALKKHGTKVVKIAYDRDEAGERAAEKLSTELVASGLCVYRVQFPHGMDANEYALKVQPAAKSLEVALRQAVWMGGVQRKSVTTTSIVELDEGAVSLPSTPTVECQEEEAAKEETVHEPMATADSVMSTATVWGAVSGASSPEPNPSLAASEVAVPEMAPMPSPAAPPPPSPPGTSVPAVPGDEVVVEYGDRRWRVRGLSKNLSHEQLRLNVLVGRAAGGFHVDTLELYSARQRAVFVKQASVELEVEERVVHRDMGALLLRLEELQDEQIKETLKPKHATATMTKAEQEEALGLLKDPRLLERIVSDFEKCGVVGEETNKLVSYLATVSRKLEAPLAIVIQSSSAAGKSSLMEAVLAMVPEEERVSYSAMTGQSLFYMGAEDLKHKILAIAEEEGAERASYALKLLQSEGELTIASTGKDPTTGKLVTHAYRVEGPVMIFLTTTALEVDEELLNRCIVLTVDEGQAQTRAIHELQRLSQTLEGFFLSEERKRIRVVHRNAQRLLRPLLVVNPYARELGFVDTRTRTRRDHMKYLTLIRTVALLHQHQRKVLTTEHAGRAVQYIEATREDIAVADRLSAAVLGRSLDEVPPVTRRLLGWLVGMVKDRAKVDGMDPSDVRFTRREVRERTGWGNTQLKVHLRRLEELEYLQAHRRERGQSFSYELCYLGEAPAGVMTGDGDAYDAKWSGLEGDRSGGGRPVVGGTSGGGRGEGSATKRHENQGNVSENEGGVEKARRGMGMNVASYVAPSVEAAHG